MTQHQLKNEFKKKERESFILSLPMDASNFLNLFDTLNTKLEEEPCDHTLKFTEQFLNEHRLTLQTVVEWLKRNGGYCDCEVLFNIEEKFENS